MKEETTLSPYLTITTMKLSKIIESIEGLNKLAELKLPATTAFKVSKLLAKIAPEAESYNKIRTQKLSEYETTPLKDKDDKETGVVQFVNKEDAEKFGKEIEELVNQEVSIDIPEITVEELGSAAIEPAFLMKLDWLIKQ